ncbi:unnamed protein product, partial [marine sediment metagenome]
WKKMKCLLAALVARAWAAVWAEWAAAWENGRYGWYDVRKKTGMVPKTPQTSLRQAQARV